MSGRRTDRLSIEKIAQLAQKIASLHPSLMPAFLWCLCRSERARQVCEKHEPLNLEVASIKTHPTGDRLVASVDKAAWRWLRRRRERKEAEE